MTQVDNKDGAEAQVTFIYISSHGVPVPSDANRTGVVVNDTKPMAKDPKNDDPVTLLTATDLMEAVRKIKSKLRILILDLCHGGGVTGLKPRKEEVRERKDSAVALPPTTRGLIVLVILLLRCAWL